MARSGRWILGAALLTVLAPSSVRAVEEQIDAFIDATALTQFVTNTNVLQNTVGSTVRLDPNLNEVIGATRQLTVTAAALVTGGDFVVSGVSPMPIPLLVYNSSFQADGSTTLLYDRNGAGLNTFLAFAMGISVQIVSADLAAVSPPGLDVTVTLTDTTMASASATQTVLVAVTPMAPLDLDFPFTGFGGVDPGSLFSIRIAIDPAEAGDVEVGPVQTFGTPEIEMICDDGIDNNNNGLTDCDDPDCVSFPGCAYEAPALSLSGLTIALAALSLIGLGALGRLRRVRR